MDFAELCDALTADAPQQGPWAFVSAVVVSLNEAVTGNPFLTAEDLRSLVAPVADAAGLQLLTPHVLRACIRKILVERFVPLARVLRDAFAVEPFEFEDGVRPLFDPIAQEEVSCGFRINGIGSTVLSLSNLVRWVLTNGMRDPASHAALVSVDRVRRELIPFPPTDAVFLEHIRNVDIVLVPLLAHIAVSDSLAAAHASINALIDSWLYMQNFAQRFNTLKSLLDFCTFWNIAEHPPLLVALHDAFHQEQDAAAGGIALPAPVVVIGPINMGALGLHVEIPPLNLLELFNGVADEEDDEEQEEEEDEGVIVVD